MGRLPICDVTQYLGKEESLARLGKAQSRITLPVIDRAACQFDEPLHDSVYRVLSQLSGMPSRKCSSHIQHIVLDSSRSGGGSCDGHELTDHSPVRRIEGAVERAMPFGRRVLLKIPQACPADRSAPCYDELTHAWSLAEKAIVLRSSDSFRLEAGNGTIPSASEGHSMQRDAAWCM
jgi:hypothetical protein